MCAVKGIAEKVSRGKRLRVRIVREIWDGKVWDEARGGSTNNTREPDCQTAGDGTAFPQICVCHLPRYLQKVRRVTSAPGMVLQHTIEMDPKLSSSRGGSFSAHSFKTRRKP